MQLSHYLRNYEVVSADATLGAHPIAFDNMNYGRSYLGKLHW